MNFPLPTPGLCLAFQAFLLFLFTFSTQGATITLMPPDTWPLSNNWYQTSYGTPVVGTATANGKQWLTIGRNSGASGAQMVYTAGSYTTGGLPTPAPSNQLADFTGHVILGADSWAAADGVGVLLRSRVTSFHGTEAYYIAVNSAGLGLYWGTGSEVITNASVTRLEYDAFESSLATLANGGEYLLSFAAINNKIEASLYASWTFDPNGSILGTPIAEISYTDARPEARADGYFSLRGGRFGSNRTAYFRELEITTIPEPSTALLGFLATGIALGAARFRTLKTRKTP